MPVVLLDGVDLLHGHGVEAHGVFQLRRSSSNRGMPTVMHILMAVVDGLGGGDLFLLPDDLRRDAGLEKVPSASRSKADLPTMEPWAKPKFCS